MSLDLFLSEQHDFAGRERQPVQSEPVRIDAVAAPAFITLGQVEELARRRAVAVEVHLQRGLLGTGERAGEVAGAMEEIVDAGRERRIVRDRRSDLGTYVADVSHVSTMRRSLTLCKLLRYAQCSRINSR
jgi:hypothetical protein